MGTCLEYCSCMEGNFDRKYAEIVNDLLRIDSDVYCRYCSVRNRKKGIVVEDPNSECLKTCYHCQLTEGQTHSPRKTKETKSPIRVKDMNKNNKRKSSHNDYLYDPQTIIKECEMSDEDSPPVDCKLNRSMCLDFDALSK